MTEAELTAYQFDSAIHSIWRRAMSEKAEITKRFNTTPAVCDALMSCGGRHIIVEFKNGRLPKKTIVNIHRKIHDSVMVYAYLAGADISKVREKPDFILVYNGEKNPRPECCWAPEETDGVLTASQEHVHFKANGEAVYYGVQQYEGRYFREVHTFTARQFEDFLKQMGG